jgi:hypothetical protein
VLAVLSDMKITIYEVEFPHPRSHTTSKWKTNYKTFCHMLLIEDKVNNTSPYLELLRNSRTRSEIHTHTYSWPTPSAGPYLHEPKVCDFFQPLPGRFRPDPEVEIGTYFPETTATGIEPYVFTCSASHVISWSVRFS